MTRSTALTALTALPSVVLVAGDPVPRVFHARGGFANLIRTAAGDAWQGAWLDVDLRDGSALPALDAVACVVVTGSASSVTDREPWVLRGEEYLRELVNARVPTFGICFGHQMLGQALGGHVARNPGGREIGTVELELVQDDPIFENASSSPSVNMTHVDSIERLPVGATVLGRTRLERHAAVRFGEAAWGVQFHPEMDGAAVRGYLETRRDLIAKEGGDPEALLARVGDAQFGRNTLQRFLRMVGGSFPSGSTPIRQTS